MVGRSRQQRTSHSLVTALRAVPSLATLDESTLLAICGDSANLFWPAGSTVFEKGSSPDGLYIVLSGQVRVLDDAGAELNALGPGHFFGELSLLSGAVRQNGVQAVQDAELMVVPRERFEALMASSPELRDTIRREAEERLAANLGVRTV